MDLFDSKAQQHINASAPLADRMRPKSLDEFLGQESIVGPDTLLRRAIEADDLPSMIFWGPPGSGKTTLATVIAQITNSYFVGISGVTAGVKELRATVDEAKERRKYGNQRTILFVDEIHRWNKAQQDGLLPFVEKGIITLIGATTENPSFEVIAPLLSRARVYVLKPLAPVNLKVIIKRALKNNELGLGKYQAKIDNEAEDFLIKTSNGDARVILNALEVAVKNIGADKTGQRIVGKKIIEEALQHKALMYDKAGDEHYNIISALHKSMRGSNGHAAVYWLARMLEAGEDPLYVARRLVRFAAEDIGLADNFAVVLANAVFEVCHKIGMPECNVHLAQLVIYLSEAKKSIRAYQAYGLAKQDVAELGHLPVPLHLRNAPTKLMKNLGYGADYKYTPLEDSAGQEYFPEELKGKKYY
ncbi:MAG: Recombination protein MgsA [Candidatus Kuenenbacteria bacterium GW2011_GWA2_42_15]|uniref:Recombination protein MgsA n=1 Tax=Candidatus Kuenenbacteria bacterium GW2011_GWA2_42_15 TaxID=1618677 RepID=A0A0G1C0E2_9BACT|nr:MAG: Recombination protein MgsA [Candidatus Kuenenbacteria bacterium GW2011_GWA2_42_15]